MWHNFMGGIAWGLGVTVGLSVLFAVLGFLGSRVDWVPVIGKFVNGITQSLDTNRPQVSAPRRATPTPTPSPTPTPNTTPTPTITPTPTL